MLGIRDNPPVIRLFEEGRKDGITKMQAGGNRAGTARQEEEGSEKHHRMQCGRAGRGKEGSRADPGR